MSEQESLKQQIEAAQGTSVNDDYFLYSCLEFERTHFPTPDELHSEHMWPRLPTDLNNCDPNLFQGEALEPLLRAMTQWYAEEYPELTHESPIDHEQMNLIIRPLVLLAIDLEKLVKIKTQRSLPAFRHGDEDHPFWMMLGGVVQSVFAGRWKTYMRYFQWCHAAEEDDVDASSQGSRPPIVGSGRPPGGGGFGGQRGGGGRSFGGGQHRGGRGGPPGGGGRSFDGGGGRRRGPEPGNGPSNGPRGQRGGSEDRYERSGGGPRNNDRRTGGGGAPPSKEQQAYFEERALKDVAAAVRKLRADESLDEVPLHPTNSFLRRLQHEHVGKSGFFSYSAGEGRDRGVIVSRTRPLGYEPEGVDLGDGGDDKE